MMAYVFALVTAFSLPLARQYHCEKDKNVSDG